MSHRQESFTANASPADRPDSGMTPQQFVFHTMQAHRTLPHGERPTRLHVDVARAVARSPHAMPSHVRIARRAGVCVRTVGNALRRLRGLGLIAWSGQVRHLPSGEIRRLPNRYRFIASFLLSGGARLGRLKTLTKDSLLGKLSETERHALRLKWGLAGGGPVAPIRTPAQQIAELFRRA